MDGSMNAVKANDYVTSAVTLPPTQPQPFYPYALKNTVKKLQ
jgi:hypothetical protein